MIVDCKLPASSMRSSFTTQFMEAPGGKNYPNHTDLSRPIPNFFPVSG